MAVEQLRGRRLLHGGSSPGPPGEGAAGAGAAAPTPGDADGNGVLDVEETQKTSTDGATGEVTQTNETKVTPQAADPASGNSTGDPQPAQGGGGGVAGNLLGAATKLGLGVAPGGVLDNPNGGSGSSDASGGTSAFAQAAAGGGGGKGMKVVEEENQLENMFLTAKNEAKKYFGNDALYIEKYFKNPRHIEVQIMSGKNKTIHLGERDCSVQRRHQKLIEETPSPVLTDEQRKDLLDKTVKMVEQIGYEGAGTVEFIYENGKFYFLEMNTRVQVEHPVTEVQTGIDIVKEQLWIAFTGETALKQSDIDPRGHSIECRINAENPALDFQPSPGTISVCHQPSGFRTRVDGSIFQGCKITPYYDSLIAKVICKGRNRTEAIQRTLRSLDEFVLEGITTTIDLHKKILNHKKFINSDFDTNWLGKEKFY